MAKPPPMPPCRHYSRHWFSYYGMPGSSAPFCVRGCGVANPRYRPRDDVRGP